MNSHPRAKKRYRQATLVKPKILFVTHDVNEAVFLSDRVIVPYEGHMLDEIDFDLPRPPSWDALNEDDWFEALSSRVSSSYGRHQTAENRPRLDQRRTILLVLLGVQAWHGLP